MIYVTTFYIEYSFRFTSWLHVVFHVESFQAPVQRVCGWDTPFPLAFEEFYLPTPLRASWLLKGSIGHMAVAHSFKVMDAVQKVVSF